MESRSGSVRCTWDCCACACVWLRRVFVERYACRIEVRYLRSEAMCEF